MPLVRAQGQMLCFLKEGCAPPALLETGDKGLLMIILKRNSSRESGRWAVEVGWGGVASPPNRVVPAGRGGGEQGGWQRPRSAG